MESFDERREDKDRGLRRLFGRARGRVQGVGFRVFTQRQAVDLGITGYVRNMTDGTVTMELQGEPIQLDEILRRIKTGNYVIRVRELELEEREIKPKEKFFDILEDGEA